MKRVVITGMGAVTPIGNSVETFWENLSAGKHGFAPITKFDATGTGVTLAAELKDFQATDYMPKKETKRMDFFSQYAVAAAMQAMENSQLDTEKINVDRFGVMMSSGIGGLGMIQDQVIKMREKGPQRVAPLFVPMVISNMAAGNVAIKVGAKGICENIVTACASGTNSIGDAFRSIKHGYSDVILAGGTEASICEIGIAGFAALTALSTSTDPDRASIPFDKDRDGFVMGEGAGVLVLEELTHAKNRGAKIYGEVVGYGSTSDAGHITSPLADGSGAGKAIILALEEAGIKPEDVDYINAHGTSTPTNDGAETMSFKYALGEAAYKIPISSSKSMFGHLLGAAGAIEGIACVKALQEGFLPPTVGLKNPDEACDLDYIPEVGRRASEARYALSDSLGFGGHNAVVCFKKWEDA